MTRAEFLDTVRKLRDTIDNDRVTQEDDDIIRACETLLRLVPTETSTEPEQWLDPEV